MTQPLAVGIDLGGTKTAFGIVDRDGTILVKGSMPTVGHNTVEDYVTDLGRLLVPLIERVGRANVSGIGVGAPNGNFYTGEIAFAPNLPWHGVIPFARLINDAIGLPVTLTNDANAAAIGEMIYGCAKGMKDFIMVTLGTGVGSGFVANGQLIYGNDGFAGELGHVIAVKHGRLCGCGRHGCLEAYASATGIAKTAEEWLRNRNDHTILRASAGCIDARMIHEAAETGDIFAMELFEFTGQILGETLADMVAITSPEAIIFFGGLAKAGAFLFDPVHRYMEANMLRVFQNKVKLKISALADADAAILGAAALVAAKN